MRKAKNSCLFENRDLTTIGLNPQIVGDAINFCYKILDDIDEKLVSAGSERLAELLELANLSAIIGNLYRGGIVLHSSGKFEANKPHTYPDLLAKDSKCLDFEIKVALENNKPKGHLVKPGPHLIIRYILANEDGTYSRGKENRGSIAWIWEIRAGFLTEPHFSVSNTEGDSGKTAVINASGMTALNVVYFDKAMSPRVRN